MVRVGLALAFFFLFLPRPATSSSPHWQTNHHELATGTWSVAAVDTDSREVGISLATCVPARLSVVRSRMARTGADPALVYKIAGAVGSGPAFELAHLVTGVGVVVAQGLVDRGNAERLAAASAQLLGGASPDSAIGAATADDRGFDERQYGIVTFRPSAANFTGSSASGWAGGSSIDVATVQGELPRRGPGRGSSTGGIPGSQPPRGSNPWRCPDGGSGGRILSGRRQTLSGSADCPNGLPRCRSPQ